MSHEWGRTAGFLAQGKERLWRVGNSEEIFCQLSRDWHTEAPLELAEHPAAFNKERDYLFISLLLLHLLLLPRFVCFTK